MAKGRRARKRAGKAGGPEPARRQAPEPAARPAAALKPAKRPLAVARGFSAVLFIVGLLMFALGVGVLTGRITEGWGFPMSAVPNWGRPWGAVLMLAGAAYVLCPIVLFLRPGQGTVAMMILSGLSILVGTPLITTTTEIFYNVLTQKDCQADWTQCRPDWIDSVWAYFMIVNVVVLIAIYKTDGGNVRQADVAPAD